jgi:hypothetical protein
MQLANATMKMEAAVAAANIVGLVLTWWQVRLT